MITDPGISDATARNWQRLNTKTAGRLTSRANKRRSSKRVLPLEYISKAENISFVQGVLDHIDENEIDIFSAVYSLGIGLLKKSGIYDKPHVAEVLNGYAGAALIEKLSGADIPEDEYDILGLIYQSFLQEGKKNIKGAYYTPQKIARSMTEGFKFDSGEQFFDPCCGSGSFLMAVDAKDPSLIFGADNDEIAVFISKLNLLLKYKDKQFIPQVYCVDYLKGRSLEQNSTVFLKTFDHIATNPPWGAMENNSGELPAITSKETFSCFFVKAFEQLKEKGTIRFLFPEAVLNVKVHRDIRKFILETAGLVSITTYDDTFSGVTTKYVDIECGRGARSGCFTVHYKNTERTVDIRTVYETENLVFTLLAAEDIEIVRAVKEKGRFTLKNSTWGLGVVTGDNKGKLFAECREGMEKIYTGKEIRPYTLLPAKKYILFDRAGLQQVAKDEIYRAPEKLVYKFISNKLIFAYDSSGSLFLNSANILIPEIPHMSIKAVLAFLNSALFQFMYKKLFGEVKILKGNLMEMPFPELSEAESEKLTALVERVLKGDSSKIEDIDGFIFSLYGLSEAQIEHIRSTVN